MRGPRIAAAATASALAAGMLLSACAPADGDNPSAISARDGAADRVGEVVELPTLSPSEVFRVVSPSIVYVETEWGSGSGVVLDEGYVITNAHVVAPFSTVSVSPPGAEAIEDVPVVGVDFAADLALLGPLTTVVGPVAVGSIGTIEPGDEVFLIGYPSETEESPTPTISEGIVSRLRTVADWDETYVQTDADIAGGQSGGALVTDRGEVIGISGMSLDEAFALALSIDDVVDRLAHLRGGGDDWHPLTDHGDLEGDIDAPADIEDAITIGLVPVDDDGTVTISFDAGDDDIDDIDDIGMYVFLEDGTFFTTSNLVSATDDVEDEDMWVFLPDGETLEPSESGAYEFEVPAEVRGWVQIVRVGRGRPIEVHYSSSRETTSFEDLDDGDEIEVGDEVRGIIEPLEAQDEFVIDLDEGDEITISATSGSSDVAFTVLAPGEEESFDSFFVDDSFIGLGGLDAEATYTAEESGEHRIVVIDNFGQGAYRLVVSAT